jgi:DNA-binding winged helix-turn-helix (wHTH) protein
MSEHSELTAVFLKTRSFAGAILPEQYTVRGTGEASASSAVQIGRSLLNDIVITQEHVSKNHARVEFRINDAETTYYIVDRGSSNGTFLNGVKVDKEAKLTHGDLIACGDPAIPMLEFLIPAKATGPTALSPARQGARLHWDDQRQLFWLDAPANQLALTPNEQRLLRYLYNNAGNVCTREELAQMVWVKEAFTYESRTGASLNMLIAELRKKLGDTKDTPGSARFIHTVRSEGYLLALNPAVQAGRQ